MDKKLLKSDNFRLKTSEINKLVFSDKDEYISLRTDDDDSISLNLVSKTTNRIENSNWLNETNEFKAYNFKIVEEEVVICRDKRNRSFKTITKAMGDSDKDLCYEQQTYTFEKL